MNVILVKIAELLRISTTYRVTAAIRTSRSTVTITMTLDVSPWIHEGNISDVERYLKDQVDGAQGINLLMIYKL